MKTSHILFVATLLIPLIGLTGCDEKTPKPETTGSPVRLQGGSGQLAGGVGRVLDDSAITAKARWVLANVRDLHDIDILMKTEQGKVILSGTVWSMADLRRIATLISGVEGVRQVENRIIVKFLI